MRYVLLILRFGLYIAVGGAIALGGGWLLNAGVRELLGIPQAEGYCTRACEPEEVVHVDDKECICAVKRIPR